MALYILLPIVKYQCALPIGGSIQGVTLCQGIEKPSLPRRALNGEYNALLLSIAGQQQ